MYYLSLKLGYWTEPGRQVAQQVERVGNRMVASLIPGSSQLSGFPEQDTRTLIAPDELLKSALGGHWLEERCLNAVCSPFNQHTGIPSLSRCFYPKPLPGCSSCSDTGHKR